jgi:hypothetical protein
MSKILFGALISIAFMLPSCSKVKQPNSYASAQYGTTATVNMSNNWWVNISLPGTGNLTPLPIFFQTYNTAGNATDSIWLDDFNNLGISSAAGDSLSGLGADFKCKTAINYSALTFSTTNSVNYYGDTASNMVTIIGGKIFPKGGHSLSGNIVDSIYMRAMFSNATNPTDTFTIAGVARTGFNEDDY